MKKTLLFTAIAGLSLGAAAQSEPLVIDNFYSCGVSDNGRYIASVTYDDTSIYDLEAGKLIYTSPGDTYVSGATRTISDNGIFLTGVPGFAWLVIDGKDVYPSVLDKYEHTSLDAITPDGKYVVGKIGNEGQVKGIGSATDYLPVFFTLENNELSEPTYLPFPATDVFGDSIQYASAIAISADASKILGLIVSGNGFLQTPILYTKDSKGEWTYSLPLEKYLNPNHITLPAQPTDNPKQWYDFATIEEIQAYNAAIDEYESGASTKYPDYWDFMTQSEYAAYLEYYTNYQNDIDNYYASLWNIIDSSINILNNMLNISPDGTKATATALIEMENPDPFGDMPTIQRYVVYDIDLTTCTPKMINFSGDLVSTGITNDGTIYCQNIDASQFRQAYIYGTDKKLTTLVDFVDAWHPGWGEWLKEKFTAQSLSGYTPTMEPIYKDVIVTGIPFANGDGTMIACAVEDLAEEASSVLKTVVYTGISTGIANVATDREADITISASHGGVVNVAGEAATVQIYDLGGRLVHTTTGAGLISTGLGSGVYIVKATAPDGKSVTAKVAF